MFDLPALQNAFIMLMDWKVLLVIPIGLLYSIIVGAIPGFTTSMAITSLLPLTYVLDPLSAIVILASAYGGAIYGGSITAILLHTPGTPASAATAIGRVRHDSKGRSQQGAGTCHNGFFNRRGVLLPLRILRDGPHQLVRPPVLLP
mgnify:FL=1